ncbi:ABC transporter permease [Actinocorallia populi]|uniref:ABC transporter permease n=1 Tax=Actinocorallia populi TaxID=2079200 RepID=UPI000D08B538|nr:ABC transporter permease [Actinocorallia populi]
MMPELRAAVAAEWTKSWSVRSTWGTLAASAVLMMMVSAQLGIAHENNNTNEITTDDTGVTTAGAIAIESFAMMQLVLFTVAILTVTSEYANRSIGWTLQAVPVRGRVLAAKAAVLAPVMFVAGAAMCLLGALAARPLLGDWGTLDGLAYDAFAMGVYSAAGGVLTAGLALVLRSTATTLTALFVLLMLLPLMLGAAGSPAADFFPSTAGDHFMSGDTGEYPLAVALLIVLAWTAAAALAGLRLLKARDA